MNCPNCGALMNLGENGESFQCEYCRSVYVPEPNVEGVRVLGEAANELCPVCSVPLVQATLAGHRLLHCKQCEGMLVPMDDFVALLAELRARSTGARGVQPSADRSQLNRRLHCPRCHQPMDTHFYEGPGNIIIDDCSPCRVNWLDSGELMRVVQAPDHVYSEDTYGR